MKKNKHPGFLVLTAVAGGPLHQEWILHAVQAYKREVRFFGRNAARSVVGYLADYWPLENNQRNAVIDFIEEEVEKANR